MVIKLYEEPDARKPQVRFCEGQIDEPFTKEERKVSRDCLLDGFFMGRKGENIFKRKDGRYEGRYIKDYVGRTAIYGYIYARSYYDCKKKLII